MASLSHSALPTRLCHREHGGSPSSLCRRWLPTALGSSRPFLGLSLPSPLTAQSQVEAESGSRRHAPWRCESTSAAAVTTGSKPKVMEVDIDTFDDIMRDAGQKLVVLDMYTQWCGPCKLIAPKLEALAQTLQDVVFLKLDCNEKNKPLAKSLGIKAVPTFKLIRNSKIIDEVQGAKYTALVDSILLHQVTDAPAAGGAPGGAQSILATGQLAEVKKDTFYPALQQAGTRLVVLEMYTSWCKPCQLLEPKLQELAANNPDLVFLKLDCNEENKPLAKSLGVVSVPTMKLFRSYELLGELRGAQYEALLELIKKHK